MANNIMGWFKVIILVQLFYAFCITGYVSFALPEDSINYVGNFRGVADEISLQETSTDIQESIQNQKDVPIIEVGALVFYSGNILLDLLFNFAFAIPQMIGLVLYAITFLIPAPVEIIGLVEIFAAAAILSLYVIGLIQLLTSVRSGRVV